MFYSSAAYASAADQSRALAVLVPAPRPRPTTSLATVHRRLDAPWRVRRQHPGRLCRRLEAGQTATEWRGRDHAPMVSARVSCGHRRAMTIGVRGWVVNAPPSYVLTKYVRIVAFVTACFSPNLATVVDTGGAESADRRSRGPWFPSMRQISVINLAINVDVEMRRSERPQRDALRGAGHRVGRRPASVWAVRRGLYDTWLRCLMSPRPRSCQRG
jgi:hypothetical protein